MQKSVFEIPKMDCPSEEKLVRMALGENAGITLLKFDLQQRTMTAFHESKVHQLLEKLEPLKLGANLFSSETLSEVEENLFLVDKAKSQGTEKSEAKVLKLLLVINGVMFFFEIGLGFLAQSTGLIADAMDMFADAAVYGVSLYAVGKSTVFQLKAARMSGYAQMALALFALFEVLRRFIFGSQPEANYMMSVSAIALVANVVCLALISRHRDGGVHMKASFIFSTNDVIANLGVLFAGILVNILNSAIPDLIIGLIIATVVFKGSMSILRISSLHK